MSSSEGNKKDYKVPPPSKDPWPEYIGSNPTKTSKIGEDPILEPPLPKVRDAHGRLVSTKKANQPFLAYGRWKAAQAEKEERRKARAERRAKGEEVSDDEDGVDSTPQDESALWALLKFLVFILIGVSATGKFITGSYVWGYQGKWVNINTYTQPFKGSGRLFSETTLAQYDGSDPNKPIYLAIDGEVFDVTAGRRIYGPGGGYHIMAGKDAARSFGTGCFETHQTHDLRGLSDSEAAGVEHWKKFFADSEKYHRVGRVIHKPIDPLSPLPEHCDPEKQKAQTERWNKIKSKSDL